MKPIIFSADMVKAIMGGTKTQTRRVTKKSQYEAGDILWIRESFYVMPEIWAVDHDEQQVEYAADIDDPMTVEDYVKKPSIHMPRWAARISLRVVDIHAEQIQDISDEDAMAEGCNCREGFKVLWDKINGKRGYGWDTNPWVWVYEFERIDE